MQADERTRVVIHREWVLDTPAHHTEVAKALTVAGQKRDAEAKYATDIVFTHGDDLIVIGYQVEGDRSSLGQVTDQILRAERDLAHERIGAALRILRRPDGDRESAVQSALRALTGKPEEHFEVGQP